MGTTDAIEQRQDEVAGPGSVARGYGPVRVGVQWGYPFSLVRQLTLIFVVVLAFCCAGTYVLSQPSDPLEILVHLVPVAAAILLSMYVAELVGVTERPLPPLSLEALFWSIASCCIVMAVGYAIVPTYAPSVWLACAAPIVAALAVYLQRKWIEAKGTKDETVPAVLFAGDRSGASRAMVELAETRGVAVKAVILAEHSSASPRMAGVPVLSTEAGLRWFRQNTIRIFLIGRASPEQLRAVLSPYAGAGCIVESVEDMAAKAQGRLNLSAACDDVTLLGTITNQANRFSAQRVFDLILAGLAVPPSLLIGLLVALVVKVTSRGPILFRQQRVGRWGRPFSVLKFRTMREDAEKETGPVWARENDPRVTAVGGIMRRLRVDELPQLWNVLKGEMSLVGPRPERPYFVETLSRKIPLYEARHSVRPGVTGWAQIRYHYAATDEDSRNKLAYELFYIRHRSFTFYFAVLLETVKVVLFQRGSR